MLRVFFLAHWNHLVLFYSPKAYHSRKGHVHDYSVKREKFSVKQEIWLFFDLRLCDGQPAKSKKAALWANNKKSSSHQTQVLMIGGFLF